MKALIILIIFSISIFCQDASVNCDTLIYLEGAGCIYYEKGPELIGGLDSLQRRLSYPQKAIDYNIEGKVYIRVIVDTTGNQFCATVIKHLGFGCDEEALRLIETSKFLPGVHKRKTYTMPISIPIVFSLKDR